MLTKFDRDVAGDVKLGFIASPGSGLSSSADMLGIGGVVYNLEFQFPPKFVSDSRKGNWVEGSLRGDEPVAVFATSGAREITLAWTYIAGATGSKGSVFTPHKVAQQVRFLRSYFSRQGSMTFDEQLVIRFNCWYHTGEDVFTCRMLSIDVSHGKALISAPHGYAGKSLDWGGPTRANIDEAGRTYALRTDVTVDLRLWSRVTGKEEAFDETAGAAAGKEAGAPDDAKIELPILEPKVPADWQ